MEQKRDTHLPFPLAFFALASEGSVGLLSSCFEGAFEVLFRCFEGTLEILFRCFSGAFQEHMRFHKKSAFLVKRMGSCKETCRTLHVLKIYSFDL